MGAIEERKLLSQTNAFPPMISFYSNWRIIRIQINRLKLLMSYKISSWSFMVKEKRSKRKSHVCDDDDDDDNVVVLFY